MALARSTSSCSDHFALASATSAAFFCFSTFSTSPGFVARLTAAPKRSYPVTCSSSVMSAFTWATTGRRQASVRSGTEALCSLAISVRDIASACSRSRSILPKNHSASILQILSSHSLGNTSVVMKGFRHLAHTSRTFFVSSFRFFCSAFFRSASSFSRRSSASLASRSFRSFSSCRRFFSSSAAFFSSSRFRASSSLCRFRRGSSLLARSVRLKMRLFSAFCRFRRSFSFSFSIHRFSSRHSASSALWASTWENSRQLRKLYQNS
mmetsp:Transcript_139757/g.243271  ORF Transcript_139757/g.243271 Transcript_139757/m.243271 type:complete len:266 (+) Transcript_139757:520-1317(+)